MSGADELRARLTREGWAFAGRDGGNIEAWTKPGHLDWILVPTNEELNDYRRDIQRAHRALDRIAADALPTPLKLAAPDLLDALTAYHARHKCGCNHPACNDCERDRVAEAALAKARGEEP